MTKLQCAAIVAALLYVGAPDPVSKFALTIAAVCFLGATFFYDTKETPRA
jgi:hypothetical protein